ncbi:MAG TPA: NAD(P)-dependent oxidoreductase [Bryobacteraceae bacterium]|nr:NAD(P)-dependent oxidoreductase [Bryobacteraceae bacterium]
MGWLGVDRPATQKWICPEWGRWDTIRLRHMTQAEPQTIFVIGATGVLGRSVIPLLRSAGLRVRALARSAVNATRLSEAGAEAVEADLFDPNSLRRATTDTFAILHLATRIPARNQMSRGGAWADNDRIRSEGTRNVAEAASANGVQAIVYPSVCFVYPDHGSGWIDANTSKVTPSSITRSTLEAEDTVSRFAARGGRGIVLRMGQFYGPESNQVQEELRLARWGVATVFGPSDSYRSVIWIQDAASAVVAALQHAASGAFDIVDDEPPTNQTWMDNLAAAVGRKRLHRLPQWVVRRAVGPELSDILSRSRRVSNCLFKDATGWRPGVSSVRDGLALCASGCGSQT